MKYIKFKNSKKITLKKFLLDKSISMRAYKDLLKTGIIVNDKPVFKNINLNNKDIVKLAIDEEGLDYEPIKGYLDVVYEDENILVVNKPSNLTVNSKNQVSLSNYIANYFLENDIKAKIRLINRLDMNTSGLCMVAKNKYAQAYYQKQIEDGVIVKKYLAYVEGSLKIDKLFKTKLVYDEVNKLYKTGKKGKTAITYFKTIDANERYSLIECNIKTGKTHQIRASLKSLDHPILGDTLYGSNINLDRFLLHSYYLEFIEFINQERIIIKNIPDFKPFLTNL